jgi:NAD(P)-dependent dehydrogenase (short-subunit alcohol dehydrogenase family)
VIATLRMTITPSTPVALVTGAAHGLGREVARQLAERGHAVLVSARDPAAAARTAEELGTNVTALPALDLTDPDSVGSVVDAIGADPGRLDVLVNNAAAFVDWSETGSGAAVDAARVVLETRACPADLDQRMR